MDSEKLQEIIKDPHMALKFAGAFKDEGKYVDALEMLEWFHFNSLAIDKEWGGVRLSFALGDWIKLAEHYPQAKIRLIEIREQDINKIRKGKWSFDDFNDVVGISRAVDDNLTPVDIFKEITKQSQNVDQIELCFSVVFDLLVDFDEKELCQKYTLKDPIEFVKRYRMAFEGSHTFLDKNIQRMRALMKEEGIDDLDCIQDLESLAKKLYVQNMNHLVKVLKFGKREKAIVAVYEAGRGLIPDIEYQKIFE